MICLLRLKWGKMRMSSEKQIEEMARAMCDEKEHTCEECDSCDMCEFWTEASRLYYAGYRKQSEGCDFCNAGSEKCGTCVKFFDYHEDGGSDRCSSEYGNEKCAYYKPVHHCSNCGAKMKGE